MTLLPAILSLALLGSTLTSCSPAFSLKAVKGTKTRVESTVTTTSSGTVEALQQAALGFGMSGRVQKISARVGDHVHVGQTLAELENTDLKTIWEDSSRELKRAQELFHAGLISRAGLDDAKKNFEVARANQDKSMIRAPFDGMVTELNLEVGELSQPTHPKDKPPIRLIDLKPRIAKGNVDEVDLSKIKIGAPARIRIPALGQRSFEAEVTRVVPFVSTTREQDRTSEIELRFKETQELLPVGASADIEVITQLKPDALAIPTRVILGRTGQRYVYRFENGRIKKVSIQIGVGNYDRTEILSGLAEGDVVVYPPDSADLKDNSKAKVEIIPWP